MIVLGAANATVRAAIGRRIRCVASLAGQVRAAASAHYARIWWIVGLWLIHLFLLLCLMIVGLGVIVAELAGFHMVLDPVHVGGALLELIMLQVLLLLLVLRLLLLVVVMVELLLLQIDMLQFRIVLTFAGILDVLHDFLAAVAVLLLVGPRRSDAATSANLLLTLIERRPSPDCGRVASRLAARIVIIAHQIIAIRISRWRTAHRLPGNWHSFAPILAPSRPVLVIRIWSSVFPSCPLVGGKRSCC